MKAHTLGKAIREPFGGRPLMAAEACSELGVGPGDQLEEGWIARLLRAARAWIGIAEPGGL